MSTTIDNRVVEMQFDNKHFERNVKTTLGTLDKLKQSLNLPGASKGLENVSAAAKKCDLAPMSNAVENVRYKFSALEVMAVTALANITNSAVNAGKRMISALTIDPIKTGFSEYETKINSIQTIMSNTASKGTTMADVTRVINELNTYADKTIYNFAEMTRNIGTFTAAGVGLEDSAAAIQGIANLAAASGSTSQQASTAMYQLSQALAAGTVKLMDWNSVVNAGMGGEKFQIALKETAREHGIAVDDMIKKAGSFRDSLQDGWITADVLNETLKKFTVEGAKEYADSMVASGKYTQEQADALIKEAQAMEDAATKVKTFTQLWDTMKESVQSGWGQTWELIVGDFEEAKEFLTGLSDTFGGIIEHFSNKRNNLLAGALNSNWEKLTARINEAGIETDKFEEKLRQCAEAGGVDVDKMIKEYGSLGKAFQKGAIDSKYLIEAFDKVQNVVTKTKNKLSIDVSDIKRSLKFGDTGDDVKKLQTALQELGFSLENFGIDGVIGKETTAAIKAFQESVGLVADGVVNEDTLKALEKAGTSIEEIGEASKKSDVSIKDLADNITTLGGRELLIESLMNVIKGTIDVFKAFGKSWDDAFDPLITSEGLYNAIEAFNKFSSGLRLIDDETGEFNDTGKKLVRTFDGLVAILDIAASIAGGVFGVAFKALKGFLSAFDLDILSVTANIGDMLVALRDWLDTHFSVEEAAKKLGKAIKVAYGYVKEWINAFLALPEVQEAITKLKDAFSKTFDKLNDHLIEAAENFLDFIERVKSMDKIDIGAILSDFFKNVAKPFFNFDGIFDNLVKIVKDFAKNIKKYFDSATDTVGGFVDKVRGFLKDHRNDLLIGGILAGTLAFAIGFGKIMGNIIELIKPFAGIGDAFSDVLDAVAGSIKAFAFKTRAEGIKDIAIALGILAASLVAIAFIPEDRLVAAGIAMGALAVGLAILAFALGGIKKIEPGSISKSLKQLAMGGTIFKIGLALLALAAALKILSGLNLSMDNWEDWVADLTVLTVILGELVGATILISKFAPKMSKGSFALLAIAGAVLLMCKAIEKVDGLTIENPDRVLAVLSGFVIGLGIILAAAKGLKWGSAASMLGAAVGIMLLITALNMILDVNVDDVEAKLPLILSIFGAFLGILYVSQFAGKHAWQAGVAIMGMASAAILIAGAMKILANMEAADIKKAGFAIGQVLIIFGLLTALSAFSGKNAIKAGTMLILMSVAIAILVGVIAALSLLEPDGIEQAKTVITDLLKIFGLIIGVSYLAGEHANVAGIMLLMMAGAIAILAGVIWALTKIEPGNMWSALAAIILLEIVFIALIKVTSNADISWKTVGQLGIMLAIVVALAAILWAMSALDVQSALPNAAAISVLLLAMVGAMKILQGAAAVSPMALVTLGAMALIAGIIGVIIGALCKYDLAPSIEAAVGISVLVLALSAACLVLAGVGAVAGPAIAGIGVLTVLVLALGFLAAIVAGIAFEIIAQLPAVGTDLSNFMTNVTPFINGVKMVDEGCATGARALSSAILALAVADLVAGVVNVGTLPSVGTHLSSFMTNVTGFATGVQTVTEQAGVGARALKDAILALSVADLVAGITNMSTLPGIGSNLTSFMTNVQGFVDNISVVDESVVTGAKNLSSVIKTLTADDISAKLSSWIPGESSLEQFGSSLSGFYEKIKGIDLSNLSTLSTNLQSVTTASNSLAAVNTVGIDSLAISLRNLGTVSIANFVNSIIAAGPQAAAAITTMVNTAAAAASANTGAFASAGLNAMTAFVSGITVGAPTVVFSVMIVMTMAYMQVLMMNLQFRAAAEMCMLAIVSGVKLKTKTVVRAFTSAMAEAITGIRNYRLSFYNAGVYLVEGFAAGIKDSTFKAVIAAKAMAKAAKNAAEAELDEHSPSKVFYGIGAFAGEGFVLALEDYQSKAYDAGRSMANKARMGLSRAMSGIQSIISNEMDVQPTIRPVLDLSEIQNGAETVNGMFADRSLALAGANIGVSYNHIGELDAMFSHLGSMNDSNNREVITAITSLREDFADLVTTISSLEIRMDSGTVVGELIGKIDTKLGQMATHKGRRN